MTSRRHVLAAVTLLGPAGWLFPRSLAATASPPDDAALARMAAIYLARNPDERSVSGLATRLGLDPEATGTLASGDALPDRVAARLRALRERELRQVDIVLVDGWVFARSEARLGSLSWLVRRSEEPTA